MASDAVASVAALLGQNFSTSNNLAETDNMNGLNAFDFAPSTIATSLSNKSVLNLNNETFTSLNRKQVHDVTHLLFTIVFTSMTTVGIAGNTLVIVAILSDKKMRRSAMNMLLVNLAFADLMNLISCTTDWVTQMYELDWPLGNVMCVTVRYSQIVFLFASIGTQFAVCWERYIAIVYPMKASLYFTHERLSLVVALIWALPITFCLPRIHFTSERQRIANDTGEVRLICQTAHWGGWTMYLYKVFECLLFYFVPLLVTIILYSIVSRQLWGGNQELFEGTSVAAIAQQNDTLKSRKNVVKMLVTCVLVYFVCYSPIQALNITQLLHIDLHSLYFIGDIVSSSEFHLTVNVIAMGCSACNPLLYTLFSANFRRRFLQLLSCGKYPVTHNTAYRNNQSVYNQYHQEQLAARRLNVQKTMHELSPLNKPTHMNQIGTADNKQ